MLIWKHIYSLPAGGNLVVLCNMTYSESNATDTSMSKLRRECMVWVQSGIIAHDALKEHLNPYGYAPEKNHPRTMDTHRQRHKFHASGGHLWYQIQT